MKSYRQSAILELVEREVITSQEMLRDRLKSRGIEATQATLSRDIRDLGLIKRPMDGAYRRPAAGERIVVSDPDAVLRRAVEEYLRSEEAVQQLLVLKTGPGQAQPMAVTLDRIQLGEIAGTIAGDDTILVICRSEQDAAALEKRFEGMRR